MEEQDPECREQLAVLGQLLTAKTVLLEHFRRARELEDLKPLLELEDNYVAAYRSGREVWIVNSLYSLNALFYAVSNGVFLYSDTIAGIASQGPIDLTWNHEAIADLMALGHLVGEDTLVRGARQVPQGTILHWDGARLSSRRFHRSELAETPVEGDVAQALIDHFLDGLRACVGRRPLATSSAGLDSRVILAGLLHLGQRPELLVMGDPASKDVQIVQQMGAALRLPVNHVPLVAREYIEHAAEICRLTNGIKSIDHWHTYFLATKSGYRLDDHVMTGNNGEHVRAVGFDYGVLALGLDQLSRFDRHRISDLLLARLWKMKCHMILRPDEIARCALPFGDYYGTRLQNRKLMSVMPNDETFVWQSDAFVLEQRRRSFQACGLRLMSEGYSPFTPYMRKSWVDVGWRLPLPWRLGSRWHRHAVERLYPRLLEFPEEKATGPMLRRQRPLAWAPYVGKLYGKPKVVPYMDYETMLRRKDVAGLLHDQAAELDDFMPQATVHAIVDEQLESGKRARLLAVLAAMAIWRSTVRDAAASRHGIADRTSAAVAAPPVLV